METKATEQARIVYPSQQNLPLEPEVVVVPPDQVPDLALPNPQDPPAPASPVHIPEPVQPQNPPVHVPNTMQPQNPLMHVPDPMQPQTPPVHVPNPVLPPAPPVQIPQLNWSYFKPEFSG